MFTTQRRGGGQRRDQVDCDGAGGVTIRAVAQETAEKVLYEVAEGIATITLNDPDTRNALSAELLSSLIAALARAREDERVRCVVLASSHEKVFSSPEAPQGMFLGGDPSYEQKDTQLIQTLGLNLKHVTVGAETAEVARFSQLIAQKKPVIFYWWTPEYRNTSLDLVEVNPLEDTQNATAVLAAEMICSAMGGFCGRGRVIT